MQTALAVRRMLGHVGRGTAVLAAQRQALKQTQYDQNDGRGDADGRIAGQQAHDEGGYTHDHDGDQESVLAADKIADASEQDRTEGADREPAAKASNAKMKPAVGLTAEKNCLEMIAASDP